MLGSAPTGRETELERLRSRVAAYFPVYETRVGPQSLLLAIHADRATLETKFDQLRQELWTLGYVPILRREHGEEFVEVVRRPKLGGRRPWINLVLLAATIGTTAFAGAMIWLAYVGSLTLEPTDFLYGALYFAGPLMAILGVHETAHYVVARRRHLDASLPYFIPIPPPYLLGTFGAFVSMREPFPDRKTLFDVGAAGPLAGLAVAVPVALAGLALSAHAPTLPLTYCGPTLLGQNYGNLLLGPSALWLALSLFFPTGLSNLHPLALAGWVGLLVTAINLLPAGTLDGGHIFRALLGERARYVSYLAAMLLFALGIFYLGWLIFGFLVLILGLRHPPPLNDLTPLDLKRYAVGALVAGVLVGGFVLVPIAAPLGTVALNAPSSTPWNHPPPPAAVGANLSVAVENRDPVTHGFFFHLEITNVSERVGSTTSYLTGPALAAWEANASWTFVLPGRAPIGPVSGGSAQLPSGEFYAINASSSVTLVVVLTDTQAATTADVSLTTSEVCPPSGGGHASTSFNVLF